MGEFQDLGAEELRRQVVESVYLCCYLDEQRLQALDLIPLIGRPAVGLIRLRHGTDVCEQCGKILRWLHLAEGDQQCVQRREADRLPEEITDEGRVEQGAAKGRESPAFEQVEHHPA